MLGDLHKASGGEKKHQPSNFLRTEQIKELINELTTLQICRVQIMTTPQI